MRFSEFYGKCSLTLSDILSRKFYIPLKYYLKISQPYHKSFIENDFIPYRHSLHCHYVKVLYAIKVILNITETVRLQSPDLK